MQPLALFSVQFALALVAYALIAAWYVAPRLSRMPREAALVPLIWVHAFRGVGGTILAPGSVDATVPDAFSAAVGYGDMATAFLALVALVALRMRAAWAIAAVWVFLIVGTADAVSAFAQALLYRVFDHPIGVNWVIVTLYVPALLVTTVLILWQLLRTSRR